MNRERLTKNKKCQSAFTLIEVMLGLFVASWVFAGAFALLSASMKGVKTQGIFEQFESINREHMYGHLASDFDRSAFAFPLEGLLEVDGKPFRASGNFIPELIQCRDLAQDERFFSILSEGFGKKGMTLALKKDQGQSLLFLGAYNTINAYYEIHSEGGSVKRFERKGGAQTLVAAGVLEVKSNENENEKTSVFKKNSENKQVSVRLPGDSRSPRFFKTRFEGRTL